MEAGFQPQVVLLTGGCGFIGANLVRWLLENDPVVRIVNLDLLTYAGHPANLADLPAAHSTRYTFVYGDICDRAVVAELFARHPFDTVLHLAAESHVDRSIEDPGDFITTNVLGTQVLLEAAHRAWADRRGKRFHHVSTDEVYGSLGVEGRFTEDSPYRPSSPYAASKAAADHLVRSYQRTYGLPVSISNSSNNYGPRQYPEKLIPLLITRAFAGQPLPIYGQGANVRDWIHVADHCSAIDCILRRGAVGETYNIGGGCEWTNLAIARKLAILVDEMGLGATPAQKTADLIRFVADRPGHDFRYAVDSGKLRRQLDWRPQHDFESGLRATVQWYADHRDWWQPLLAGARRER